MKFRIIPVSWPVTVLILAAGLLVVSACGDDWPAGAQRQSEAMVESGMRLFITHCGSCHGVAGRGMVDGPPLVHKIYGPASHRDEAIRRAIRQGVVAHHWEYGDMPPIPGVTETEEGCIIAYIREMQKSAGIF